MGKTFLRLKAIKARSGLSTSTIYEGVRDGWFPRPVKLGPRASGWDEDEFTAWQESRLAERDAEAA